MSGQNELTSWGRVRRGSHKLSSLPTRFSAFPQLDSESVLPVGNGRSYGDCGLNVGQSAITMRALDRFIAFDPANGRLRCEAGVLLDEILQLVVVQGWFLPVTPGTRFVTVGGAIANDVHGKNHHRAGNFGAHIARFELLRSNGERLLCSATDNADWFAATVGGLGLTGIITWAELQLLPIAGPFLAVESLRFNDVSEYVELCDASDKTHDYTVAWIDCASGKGRHGRGLFSRANHSDLSGEGMAKRPMKVPFTPPFSLVNTATVRAFNTLYFNRHPHDAQQTIQHFRSFFYPLDGVLDWNRIYGPRGFHQYQCLIPSHQGIDPIEQMLGEISASGCGSFLAVLKRFGLPNSPGLLSFPQPGLTLALDFPETGASVHALFSRLDAIVAAAKGRIYPAKDSRMPPGLFHSGYPQLDKFMPYKDPKLSSDFWRRMMETT